MTPQIPPEPSTQREPVHRRRHIDPHVQASIARHYITGASMREVARNHAVSYTSVHNILNNLDVPIRAHGQQPPT